MKLKKTQKKKLNFYIVNTLL